MLASPWMTPGGRVNSSPAYRARIWASIAVRKARSCEFSQLLASIRCRAFANGDNAGRCRSSGAVSWCSLTRTPATSATLAQEMQFAFGHGPFLAVDPHEPVIHLHRVWPWLPGVASKTFFTERTVV